MGHGVGWVRGTEQVFVCLWMLPCKSVCVTSVSAAIDVRVYVPLKVLEHMGRKKI